MRNWTLDGTDLGFLVGATLTQVAIGENETILHLHPDSTILIQSEVIIKIPGEEVSALETAVEVGSVLLPLLGKTVTEAVGTPRGSLALTWSDGRTVEVLNDSDQYECYSVTHGTDFFVV
jgi:Family of unknown function (DUF6188)